MANLAKAKTPNPTTSKPQVRPASSHALQGLATVGALLVGAWWWRNFWLRELPAPAWLTDLYFIHHAITPVLGLAIVAWALAGFPGRWRVGRGLTLWWGVFAALVAWMFLAPGPVRNADMQLSLSGQWLLIALFVLASLHNGPAPRWIAAALAAGMVLAVGVGLGQVALQSDLGIRPGLNLKEFRLDPARSGISVVGAERYLRPYGLSAHPNLWVGGVVLGFFAVLPLWAYARWRPLAALLSGLAWWGIWLSFSRAALAATVLGLAFFVGLWILRGGLRPPSRVAVAAGVLLLGVALLFAGTYADLLAQRYGLAETETPGFTEFSGAARGVYEEQARALIPAHFWRGVGVGNFAWESAALLRDDWRDLRGDVVHNVYLLAWAETGLVGLALYLTLIGGALLMGMWRAWRGRLSAVQMALLAGCVAWLAIGYFEHYLWTQLGHQALFWAALTATLTQPRNQNDLSGV